MTEGLMELVNQCEPIKYNYDPKIESALARSNELKQMGLIRIADQIRMKANEKKVLAQISEGKYIEILPDKIRQFLKKKADEYNKQRKENAGKHIPSISNSAIGYGGISGFAGNIFGAMSIPDQRLLQSIHLARQQAQMPSAIFNPFLTSPYRFVEPTVDLNGGGPIGKFAWVETPIHEYPGLPPQHVIDKLRDEVPKQLFHSFVIATVESIHDPLLLGVLNGREERYFLAQWGDDVSLDDVI